MKTLKDLIEKRGREFVEKLLEGEIVLSEKIDTYRILFEKVNGEIQFRKKDNTPLNLIERVLTNIWEDAIVELSIILENHNIPEGLKFGVAYTPSEKPIRLQYNNIPKYFISDISRNGELLPISECMEWSKILGLGRPSTLFSGKLDEESKKFLIGYSIGEYGEETSLSDWLEQKFGTYSKEPIIEGVVIKTQDNENTFQLLSYEFQLINETYNNIQFSRDFYDLVLLNLNSFMEGYQFPVLEGEAPDELYINIICDIFNSYCKNMPIQEGMRADYLSPPNFGNPGRLNVLLIKNKETLKILEEGGPIYEALFRVILSSLRKYKKEQGLLTEEAVDRFNTYVYLISERTGIQLRPLKPTLILEGENKNIVIDTVNKKLKSDIDNMRVIASIQKAFEAKNKDPERGEKKCVVYISNFSPLTRMQSENIQTLYRTWKAPVILAYPSNQKTIGGGIFRFSDELILSQLEAYSKNNLGHTAGAILLDDWGLRSLFLQLRPEWEPLAIITDKDRKADLVLQLYFEDEVMDDRINVLKDFNIGEMDVRDRLSSFRSIEDGLYYSFKEYTPEPIWNFFDLMSSEWRTWQGSNVRPFEENIF